MDAVLPEMDSEVETDDVNENNDGEESIAVDSEEEVNKEEHFTFLLFSHRAKIRIQKR